MSGLGSVNEDIKKGLVNAYKNAKQKYFTARSAALNKRMTTVGYPHYNKNTLKKSSLVKNALQTLKNRYPNSMTREMNLNYKIHSSLGERKRLANNVDMAKFQYFTARNAGLNKRRTNASYPEYNALTIRQSRKLRNALEALKAKFPDALTPQDESLLKVHMRISQMGGKKSRGVTRRRK